MPEPRTLRLQRDMASLILEPAFPGTQAFGPGMEGLALYRDLVRWGLEEALEDCFPVTRALLEAEGAWRPCVDAFLAARRVTSRHYRDIPGAFLGWLAQTSWGLDRWPYLLELAHFEILEVLVERFEDSGPAPAAGPGPALAPAAQLASYAHAVHRATEAQPRPAAKAAHLLAYRDAEGRFQLLELTPALAALLHQARTKALPEALAALGLEAGPEVRAALEDLRIRGAIRGNLAGE